ncbi:MAG: hemin uptake protein HemP [Arenimonas sp.]|nr:hemin uptake protein HemP [Arenimonas sp.]
MATQPVSPTHVPPAVAALGPPGPSNAEFDSRQLMRGAREVLIHHAGQVYRLRHTRSDKLILVK